MMSPFVQTAKRLYKLGSLQKTKLDDWLVAGTVTEEEYNYIIA